MTATVSATSRRLQQSVRQRAVRPARRLVGMTAPLLLLLAAAGALLAWRDYNARRDSVIVDTQLLARAAAADADRFLRDRLEALTVLAQSPTVRSGDVAAMQAYFHDLADQPTFARLSWFDLSGVRRASNLQDPPSGPLVAAGREYFRTVIATSKPYIDGALTSLQDGKPIVTAAAPTFTADGALSGVLVNPLTLDQVEGILATFQWRDAVVMVIDRSNQVIVDADPGTGFQAVRNIGLPTRARAQGLGTVVGATGPLGLRNRLMAFALAPTGDWVVVISRAADATFAGMRRTFLIEVATILGLTAAGIGGALWLGRRFVREALVQEQAHEAAGRLAAIVASSDDAVIGLTPDGLITSWNASAEQIFGLSAAAARGRPLRSLVAAERAGEIAPLIELLRAGNGVKQYETVGADGAGRRLDLSLTLSPLRNALGEIAGGSVIAHDITERKQAEAERELLMRREHEARTAAESANRAKDEFLSVVSHELRTPLTTIVGFSQLLRRRPGADPQTAQMLATIDRSAHVQMRLVNDLLDHSRLMTGKLQLACEPLQLAEIVEAAVAAVRPEAETKQVTLKTALDPACGRVMGDADRLLQIVANLLDNALKFTPTAGHIAVRLDCDRDIARLVVRDDGIGISPQFLPHVFDRFRQADGSHTRLYGGLGLGLTIVQSLVELHGGSITAASAGDGHGAAFTVHLPLSAAPPAPDRPARAESAKSEPLPRPTPT